MAVTDMTGSLPWWARGGSPQSQGPQPPQGVDPQAWLTYLSSMFGPSSAQAAEPDLNSTLNSALAARAPGPPAPDNTIPTAPVAAAIAQQSGSPILPQARGAAVPPGPMASGTSILPEGAAQASTPFGPPVPPGGLPQGRDITVHPRAAVPGPMAQGANNRFIGIDAPNASPQNSMRAGPQGTALNLAGLFGGGQPAAAAPGAQNVPLSQTPMPPPRPRVPGPLASAPMPPVMPDDIRRQRAIQLAAARSGFA